MIHRLMFQSSVAWQSFHLLTGIILFPIVLNNSLEYDTFEPSRFVLSIQGNVVNLYDNLNLLKYCTSIVSFFIATKHKKSFAVSSASRAMFFFILLLNPLVTVPIGFYVETIELWCLESKIKNQFDPNH